MAKHCLRVSALCNMYYRNMNEILFGALGEKFIEKNEIGFEGRHTQSTQSCASSAFTSMKPDL